MKTKILPFRELLDETKLSDIDKCKSETEAIVSVDLGLFTWRSGVDFTKGFKKWYKFSTEIRFMLVPSIVLFIAHEFITEKFWHNR